MGICSSTNCKSNIKGKKLRKENIINYNKTFSENTFFKVIKSLCKITTQTFKDE